MRLSKNNFSSLKGNDLLELLVETENTKIEYRDSLKLPQKATFGFEIEYEGYPKSLVKRYIKSQLHGWKCVEDESLTFGGEVISPILVDSAKTWNELKTICAYLKKRKVITNQNAGGHIHVGAHIIGGIDNWKKFLKTYALYEEILYRFFYGDKLNERKRLYEFAYPIAPIIKRKIEEITEAADMKKLKSIFPYSRNYGLNINNVSPYDSNSIHRKNTIEFRSPNSTTEEVIWQNNINTIIKLILSISKDNFDEEFVDYSLLHEEPKKEYQYREINLKKVLEFVDLIFETNEDKIYFLRQYLKEFETAYSYNSTINSKKFVKK